MSYNACSPHQPRITPISSPRATTAPGVIHEITSRKAHRCLTTPPVLSTHLIPIQYCKCALPQSLQAKRRTTTTVTTPNKTNTVVPIPPPVLIICLLINYHNSVIAVLVYITTTACHYTHKTACHPCLPPYFTLMRETTYRLICFFSRSCILLTTNFPIKSWKWCHNKIGRAHV